MDQDQADRLIAALAEAKLPTIGLKWRPRKSGRVPYWYPDEAAVKAGYPVKSANLDYLNDPLLLSQRCVRLQEEMLDWIRRQGQTRSLLPSFDYSFKALIELYISDPESPFNNPSKVDPNTKRIYATYATRLIAHIGTVRVDGCDGRDVQRWFDVWAERERPGDPHSAYKHLARGRMVLTVLKNAVVFGIISQRAGSHPLLILQSVQAILSQLQFPGTMPRTQAPTAQQVETIRRAAHAAGRPHRALAYALQYETTLRQWDVTGKWVAMAHPLPSAVLFGDQKWIGPQWSDIDHNMILSWVPNKTRKTTGKAVAFDLRACPMVLEELEHIAPEHRQGPLIILESTGRPYTAASFDDGWRADFAAAGIPKGVWNRDLRAGGNTEASKAGASTEDRAKVSGHSEKINAKVYDRDSVEAHRRVMAGRLAYRAENDE